MRLTKKQLAPAFFAVLYGSLVVLGQALHHLPGMSHSDGTSAQACSCCLDHCDGPEQENKTSSSGKSSTDCPICTLLALAQDRVTHTPAICIQVGVVTTAPETPLSAYPEPFNLYSARGPPSLLLRRI